MTTQAGIEVFQEIRVPSHGLLSDSRRAARRNPVGAVAGVLCLLLVLLAIFGPAIAPHKADQTGFARLHTPSRDYPFGTDNLFRDMYSRIIVGARNSLGVGFASVAVGTLLGVTLGITAGYFGHWWDMLVGRMVDVMLAYPAIVFIIFFLSIFPRSFSTVCIAIGLILTPGTTRIVRSATLAVRYQQYIEAAIAVGARPLTVLRSHVLPNVTAPIIVIASVQIGIAILVEATISFLGLGISSARNPSWGRMLQETRPVWQLAWWTAVVPGAAISLAVLSFNIFGDALRDALDPRLRGSR